MLLPARPNQALNALRPRLRRLQRLTTPRAHSSPLSSLQSAPPETLSVPCRSNGAVTLSIYRPRNVSQPTPVLIYLPPGLSLPGQPDDQEDASIAALLSSSNSTVVRVNYRLSQRHRFPSPVHDVLTAYDWILRNLVKPPTTAPPGRSTRAIARLGVYGELVGGGLAAMLALTECKLGSSRIGAAAINNPIVDWVFPDELSELIKPAPNLTPVIEDDDISYGNDSLMNWGPQQEAEEPITPKPKKTPRSPKSSWKGYSHNTTLPTTTLIQAREAFFKKQEDYFDRFASPVCFFRSPKGQLVYPEHEDALASSSPPTSEVDSPNLDPEQGLHDAMSEVDSHWPGPALPLPTLLRCRAYYRRFPPAHLDLDLPSMIITTGSESPLLDQAVELNGMMKRAVARSISSSRHARDSRDNENDQLKAKAQELADRKVFLNVQDGLGLWTGSHSTERWRKSLEETGLWFKTRIKP